MEKVDKKYNLNNSYFKYRKDGDPDTILEIAQYQKQFCELPFDYGGDNWIYDAFCERQKRKGVIRSQYLTPDTIAEQLAGLTDNFIPDGLKVLNACCGIGQITKYLLDKGLSVEGFDIDSELVDTCSILYPQAKFYQYDYMDKVSEKRWDLIVANPPFEKQLMKGFVLWLETALTKNGKAIFMIPSGYLDKNHPKELMSALNRFNCQHWEKVEGLKYPAEIIIMEHDSDINNDNKENNTIKNELMKADDVLLVGLDKITPNPLNQRKRINKEELEELAQSIREHGLLHPIALREKGNGYEIVYGERRYRAYLLNGETTIPAIIKQLSDSQVLEIALVENIIRKDLSVMEESDAFQQFLDSGNYTIEDVCTKSGKSDSYVRNRLRLQNIIDEFKVLLDNEEIAIGIGFELSKYAKSTQKHIYKEHFIHDDNTNWKELGVKDFTGRIERLYTNDLTKFNFDKSECESCQFNTALYELFPTKNGRCTNGDCLLAKKNKYTASFCVAASEKYPHLAICIAPYDKLNDEVNNSLQEQGIEVVAIKTEEYPQKPQKPERTDFSTEEEFNIAMGEYTIDDMGYASDMDEIEAKVQSGEYRRVVYIGDNNPKLCYARVDPKEKTEDPKEKLIRQDEANKENVTKGTAKEIMQLLQSLEISTPAFSAFEEGILLFMMLDSLDRKHYPLVGIDNKDKRSLTDEEKYKIMKGATAEQILIIKRDFIIRNIGNPSASKYALLLLMEFSKLHFPQETADLTRKHLDIYNQKKQKLQEQMNKLKAKQPEHQLC